MNRALASRVALVAITLVLLALGAVGASHAGRRVYGVPSDLRTIAIGMAVIGVLALVLAIIAGAPATGVALSLVVFAIAAIPFSHDNDPRTLLKAMAVAAAICLVAWRTLDPLRPLDGRWLAVGAVAGLAGGLGLGLCTLHPVVRCLPGGDARTAVRAWSGHERDAQLPQDIEIRPGGARGSLEVLGRRYEFACRDTELTTFRTGGA